ncbi:MAG: inositol monophosphatase [Sedimentisphaerales bacterium]|jgi:myo-inositol-1(or 4)-monophosphatase|nr:inositol monophosphatase [Sedimentisphaerales bacterium]
MEYSLLPMDAMLNVAMQAARAAASHAIKARASLEVSVKGTTELVTNADMACQALIIEQLRAAFPGHGIVAEEGPAGNLLKVPPLEGQEVWWAIDPIDGTQNFAKGIPIFAVSIAAIFKGRPVVAVVYDPCQDLMFTATAQGQALCNAVPIQINDEPIGPFVCVGLDSHLGNNLPGWVEPIVIGTRFRNLGSAALHLAYVAKGAMAAAILCMPKVWDIAAGTLIAQQAGAIVSSWNGRPIWPMDLDQYQGQITPTLAANPTCHRQIIEILNR